MPGIGRFHLLHLRTQMVEGARQNRQNKAWRRLAEQQNERANARLMQEHSDQAIYWEGYPHPTPLFPRARRLYRQADREVRRALAGWINPWVASPDCYFVIGGVPGVAACRYDWHQVWIDKAEAYRRQLVDAYAEILSGVMHPRQAKGPVEWEGTGQQLSGQSKRLRAFVEDDSTFSKYWLPLERELLAAWERSAQQERLFEMEASYESLLLFRHALWELLHIALIHELVHNWTKRADYQAGERWVYQLAGVMRYNDAAPGPGPLNLSLLHETLHESITDWIAQRIYGVERAYHWQGWNFKPGYPTWLVEKMVLALNRHWRRIGELLPSFLSESIPSAEELLYTIYFKDQAMVVWLEKALAALSGDEKAFEKLSSACELFGLKKKSAVDEAQLRQAFGDVGDVLWPYLEPQERVFTLYFEVDFDGAVRVWDDT